MSWAKFSVLGHMVGQVEEYFIPSKERIFFLVGLWADENQSKM